MDDNIYDKNFEYINLLKRINKTSFSYEGLLIIKKQYFTNNIFYYILCIFFRFIHLILFCLDNNFKSKFSKKSSIINYLKFFTIHNILEKFEISFETFIKINFLILILSLIRLLIIIYIIKIMKNGNKLYLPNKIQIIYDHIIFLLFPYLIEYLSFIYYLINFPNAFIIKSENKNLFIKYFFVLVNLYLIIIYNIENYFNIICSNKIFSSSIFEIMSKSKNINYNNNKSIRFKCSNIVIYIIILIQNFILFLNIGKYLNITSIMIFKIAISILILLTIFLLFIYRINVFNYVNFLNTFFNIINLFCLYSIILDLILFVLKYRIFSEVKESFFIFIKIILSYITNLLFILKSRLFLESKITEILFKKKIDQRKFFIDCLYYLHQIMREIKENNEITSSYYLMKILNNHINDCNQISCNCNLFNCFKERNNKKSESNELKNYLSEFHFRLNYLFEYQFLHYDFYKSFDLIIILAEHFCYIKNNSAISFSLITTFILKQKNKLNKFQLFSLYELSQKYINFLSLKVINDIEKNIIEGQIFSKKRVEELNTYYKTLKISSKVKKLIHYYINNEIKILKYKFLFEDSLSFQFDENNENIISIKIPLFDEKIAIDNLCSNENNNKINRRKNQNLKNYKNNLYIIIYLLKEEKIFYQKIINSLNQLNYIKNLPIFMIFKYFLFFDFFEGGKIPLDLVNKLYHSIKSDSSIYNGIIEKNDFKILKRKYNEHNNKMDSKFYSIYEFKREIRTKYFTEDAALKLGYKQTDIINEKIDILMPKKFYKSHENTIKQIIIESQTNYNNSKEKYLYNKTNTILYPTSSEICLIHNISKTLLVITSSVFVFKNEYIFMLDNNFELLSSSKNFEDEYYLNQKLFNIFNLELMNIINIKIEKLNKYFEKEFNEMKKQKFIRQIKSEEYFIPQLYEINKINYSEINILPKILHSYNLDDNITESNNNGLHEDDDDDEKKFIKKEEIKISLSEILIKQRQFIFHKTYDKIINKRIIFENIAKELTKIPDNDLMFENDKVSYNLILHAKKLIQKLLTKNELLNDFIKVSIRMSFYFDKPFYFILINDEKKSYLNHKLIIHFENNQNIKKNVSSSKTISSTISKKESEKNKNNQKNISNKNKKYFKALKTNKKINNNKNYSFNTGNENKDITIYKMNNIKKNINKDKVIIIKLILTSNIIIIIILYIFIIYYQNNIVIVSEHILISYYYNLYTKDSMLYFQSTLLQIYYDYMWLAHYSIITEEEYEETLIDLTSLYRVNYYLFWDSYFYGNLAVGKDFNLIYSDYKCSKLTTNWKESNYETYYAIEIDVVIYKMYYIDIINRNSEELIYDMNNYLFFQNSNKRIYTNFIRMIHYFSINFEFAYKELFQTFDNWAHDIFNNYIKNGLLFYIMMEIFGLILYIIFFVLIISYLYYSNNIFIKNIIFLFLDFNEGNNKEKTNIINLKIKEFQNLIEDFDLYRLEIFSKNVDNLDQNRYLYYNNNSKNIFENNIINEKKKVKIDDYKSDIKLIENNSLNKSPLKDQKGIESRNKGINNSSINNLEVYNSLFLKDKIKNISFNENSKDLFINNFISNSKDNNISQQSKNDNFKKEENNQEIENIQEIILNKSIKPYILMIKLYFYLILIIIALIIAFIIYKITFNIEFNNNFEDFFNDFFHITNRYSLAFYYFNIIRTLLIFPEGPRKEKFEKIMEEMTLNYDKENEAFINVLSNNINKFPEILKLFEILMESKNNSTEVIKENFCEDNDDCLKYLNSELQIFDSGIDFAYKLCIQKISNIFSDYNKIKNKTDINEINSTLINNGNLDFIKVGLSLSNMFYFIQEKIYECFDLDILNFYEGYSQNMILFNILSIILSIIIFLFVIIIIFFSIEKYINSIKESSFRINYSFVYIQNYNIKRSTNY